MVEEGEIGVGGACGERGWGDWTSAEDFLKAFEFWGGEGAGRGG